MFFDSVDTDKNSFISKEELNVITALPIYRMCYENAIYDAEIWLDKHKNVYENSTEHTGGFYHIVL